MRTIKNRLKEVREKKGVSQTALSEMAGVSRMTIIKIESDRETNITTDTMASISKALETPLTEIFLF